MLTAGLVQTVAPGVQRVMAPNPSALTGPGTNSYLVGSGSSLALIDPGPDMPAHGEALLAALGPGQRISHILVTHPHRDHSGLARRLADLCKAPVLGFGGARDGRSAVMQRLAAQGLTDGGEGADTAFRPDRILSDGDVVGGDGWALQALHTPGHMGPHLCFALGSVLFSGDHVMGWSSTLVSPPDGCMASYMASLAALSRRDWTVMLPGHGPAIDAPAARLAELIAHRRAREAAILAALAAAPQTPRALTLHLYTDTAPALHAAAERNVLAHLVDLAERNLVVTTGPVHAQATFSRRDGD